MTDPIVSTWGGRPNYLCPFDNYSSLSEDKVREHIRLIHGEAAVPVDENFPTFWYDKVRDASLTNGLGNDVIFLGDSITRGDSSETATLHNGGGACFPSFAAAYSNGKIRLERNSGIGGDTTTMMLARLEADVIDHEPDLCVIHGGTNDLNADVSVAAISANLITMCEQLVNAGIRPVLTTVLPRINMTGPRIVRLKQLNAWIKQFGQVRGFLVLDLHDVAVDPATGGFLVNWSSDGVHPLKLGADLLGQHVATKLGALLPEAPLPLTQDILDTHNLLLNGVFIGDGDVDGVANNWTFGGSGGTQTKTLEADAAIKGNWQQIVVTAQAQRWVEQSVASGFSVGDRLHLCGRLQTTGLVAGGLTLRLNLEAMASGVAVASANFWFDLGRDVLTTFSTELVVPETATSVRFRALNGATGTGTYKLAQVTLRNLTTILS